MRLLLSLSGSAIVMAAAWPLSLERYYAVMVGVLIINIAGGFD